MKSLNGQELAGFIKERQARAVRGLRQQHKITPKLAIIVTINHPVIDIYVRLKKKYGADILIDVDIHHVEQASVAELVNSLNTDDTVHGIIIQLPLADPSETDELVKLVTPNKDVDALGESPLYDPATPMAILWLLAGYNIDLEGKNILLIGRGKLVGAPLERMLSNSGYRVMVADRTTADLKSETLKANVIITAAGSPAIIFSDMVSPGAVIVDAGVASEDGKTVGDVALEVYERDDLTITPVKGGVGPLTVCALFENVIRAARGSLE